MSAHVHVPWKAPQHPASVKPLLEGLDLASPVRSGCMYKEAHTHVVFHKRFFVLFPRVLVYYEKEADYKRDLAKGSLEHRHKAIVLDSLYLSKPEKKVKGAKFCFILHAPDKSNPRHDFLLVTESREERKHWIEALQEQNPALLSSEDHSLHIHPDTPQIPRRSDSSSSTSSNGVQHHHVVTHPSMLVTDHPARPGSPRHDIQKVASSDSCASMSVDYLDIRQLSIREGPSDTEEDNN
ncbi:hypothetical protein GBAR_LOCUS9494 [Geodia barretti]|uniref:PH domain-containing protein n=1 Tax=Geodia barretti TaxID=519541 RepID=A0AA35WCD6_GEOBA|nr:hypothetical protein GBAR_LOCUS9494 [Geodia barretti]